MRRMSTWERRTRQAAQPAVTPAPESYRERLVNSVSRGLGAPKPMDQVLDAGGRSRTPPPARARTPGTVKRIQPTGGTPAPGGPVDPSVASFIASREAAIKQRAQAEQAFTGRDPAAPPSEPSTGFPANWNQYHEQDLRAIGHALDLKAPELNAARNLIAKGESPRQVIEDLLRGRRQKSDERGSARLQQATTMGAPQQQAYVNLLRTMKLQGKEQNKVLELLGQGRNEAEITDIVTKARQVLARVNAHVQQAQMGNPANLRKTAGAQLGATRGNRGARDIFLDSLLATGRR